MICSFFFVSYCFIFLFLPWVGCVGLGSLLRTDRVCSLSPGLAQRTPNNNNNNNNNSLAFRTPVLLRLLLDLDIYGGVKPLGVFPLFLKMVVDIIAPKLCIIFRWLISRGSFLECWRSANIAVIPKGAPSPARENYCPISITPILFKVYEK